MINRLKILARIDDIEEEHCASCTIDKGSTNKYCYTKCDVGKELRSYGDQLLGNRQDKVEETLAKGKDMTTNEVKYLLDQGVTRKKIGRLIGVPTVKNAEYFNELEGGVEMTTKIERARKIMQKDKDIKAKDLAEKIDVSVNNAYVYMSKIRNESTKPVKKAKSKEVSPNRFERENKTLRAELKAVEKEKEGLEQINENHLEMIKQRDEEIENKDIEIKEIKKSVTPKESWIAKIKSLENQLQKVEVELEKRSSEFCTLEHDFIRLEEQAKSLDKQLLRSQQRNDELVRLAEKEIDKLQTELETERASHENLSKYAVILMQKESDSA